MLEPDGRIYFAGAYLSQLTGWMQGAIEAAWIQVEALHQRVQSS
jgi:monoamine oxidase